MDLSTAPSSSNMNYFNQSNAGSYSSQFWRNPQQQQQQQQYTPLSMGSAINTSMNTSTGNTSMRSGYINEGEVDKLKLQIQIKESQIESLEAEIQRLNEGFGQSNNGTRFPTQVPQSVNEMFVKMSTKFGKASRELVDTKQRLETLVTAITLNPSNDSTNGGRYDELEISHKILIKLENLKKENEELMKQLSFGKVKQMELELNLLKRENEELKRENAQFKKVKS